MGSSQFDIVARLQLKAEQFSSEGGRSFAEMAARAKSTAAGIRQDFGQSFAEVQKLAQVSLKMPRTASGSLDLSGEIASLREAAAAADQKAAVARELNAAMLAASSSSRTVTEAMRLEADAAMVAARGEEADANAIRQRILALEAVQVQLNKTVSATTAHTRAANDNKVSAEQQRQSQIMLGQQLQDFTVQVGSGQSVATAFTQQIGQASFALQGMGGRLAGVASFLTSGWGIAATIGLTMIGPLVAKILDKNNALSDAVDKLKKDAEQTAITAQAKDLYARSVEGVTAAIADQLAAQDKAIEGERTAAENANINARAHHNEMLAIRAKTQALLEDAIAQEEIDRTRSQAPGQRGELATLSLDVSSSRVAGLKAQLEANQKAVADAAKAYNASRVDLAQEQAKRDSDPIARLNKLYDDQERAARNAARGNAELTQSLKARLLVMEKNRQAALQAERDRQSAANRKAPSLGSQLTSEQGGRILSAAQGFNGARENTASGKATLKDLFGTAGISIDPEKTAWCAAFVNAILAGQGIKGNGSLAARSFLNYGTATSKPEKGDIVVLRTGKTQEHVGFYAGEGKNGRILVTGGNQDGGKAVSTSSFARSQVEAFRRAPTASASYAAELKATATAAREAEQEQKKLDKALDDILGKFDPAADAARRYREELDQIDKLARAGKITPDQQLSYVRNAKKDYTAAQSQASDQLLRDTFGDAQVTAALAQFDAGVAAGVEVLKEGVDAAAESFGDGMRSAVSGALDLLGVRINGPLGSQLRNLLQPGGIEGQAKDVARSLTDSLKNSPLKISPESIQKLSGMIGSAVSGAAYGQLGGSVFASITGGKQSQLGSAVGGVLGKVAGDALGKTVASTIGGTLGKTLGGAAGPLGAIAGGIIGNVIGGLFKKTSKGSAGITTDGSGGLVAAGASGSSAATRAQASTLAGSVAAGLQAIAEQLGAKITGTSDVQIGTYKDNIRVAPNGGALGGKGSHSITFQSEEAAIKFAIQEALRDGVLSGISAASLNILRSGQDITKSLTKALMIEAVPKDLKAMIDPLGAAIDELNTKFQKTVDALKEGGATAEQMAQAQRLYDLQLAQVKNSTASASQGLKDFLASMKVGSSSPYSLRDQEQAAKAALAPFLTQIANGQSIDQAKYQSAAQAYLDIERQLYGSTKAYFDALDAVQAATNKAISSIDNATPIGKSVESPFAQATAASAAATATNTQTATELLDQLSQQAAVTNDLLARLAAAAGSAGSDFIGTDRNFVAAA